MADEKPIAANVLGTIGTVLWCVQLLPQIWHNWRRKKTDGLPASMLLLWAICSAPFGVYMILEQVNIPIQVQPQIFAVLSLFCWAQILYYNHGYSAWKATVTGVVTGLLMGGAEALLILTLRIPYNKGVTWPNLLVGIVASILLIAGLGPPYMELWKRRGRVIGINWVFLAMDTTGGITSLFALIAEKAYDPLGLVLYLSIIVLEAGIFLSHQIWRFRFRALRREAKDAGATVDEILEMRTRSNRASFTSGDGSKAEEVPSADKTVVDIESATQRPTVDPNVYGVDRDQKE